MSRGLGVWQQRILSTLEQSQNVDYARHAERGVQGLWHRVGNFDVILEPGIYDLDVVRYLLEREYGHHDQAVSRAVRTLITRGVLRSSQLVPIQAYEPTLYSRVPWGRVEELSDGTYLHYPRRARFVTCASSL